MKMNRKKIKIKIFWVFANPYIPILDPPPHSPPLPLLLLLFPLHIPRLLRKSKMDGEICSLVFGKTRVKCQYPLAKARESFKLLELYTLNYYTVTHRG